ncbi:dimethylarginine dimethylaminohydrolase family protein [Saccharopolyspora rosea]|uniref:Dimethylarginine dimethylaminohydrolase family protein n=1 Tax=Saccharopolyspora rosea TaxID=524884 RepID=A0ABW3FRX5_9PSEU|nr:arginine deiminase family protein [Saccharopolyspora rosea]
MDLSKTQKFGVRSMSSELRRVLLRAPALTGDFAAADWREPDPDLLARQHERFAGLLADLGCEVEVAPAVDGLVDATYARDPALVTGRGAILFEMAKPIRRAEPELLGEAFEKAGVPILGRLTGDARADGGDFVWLDAETLLVGRSYRTNDEGIRQIAELVEPEGVRVTSVDVPHDQGPEHVLHLMSFLSPLAPDLAAVHLPLAPVRLVEELHARGVTIVPVDDAEYATMACNVLAVRPRVVVMVEGNPRTRAALEAHGCEVHTYAGSEISVKGDGGPTCLTAPLLRD